LPPQRREPTVNVAAAPDTFATTRPRTTAPAGFGHGRPMFWSNTFAGAVLVLLGLAGLATAGRATR
jgi:hypothetical protein